MKALSAAFDAEYPGDLGRGNMESPEVMTPMEMGVGGVVALAAATRAVII